MLKLDEKTMQQPGATKTSDHAKLLAVAKLLDRGIKIANTKLNASVRN